MTQINAYIGFNGVCREAMNFYKDCLGGDLMIQTIGESPMAAQFPPSMKEPGFAFKFNQGPVINYGNGLYNTGGIC